MMMSHGALLLPLGPNPVFGSFGTTAADELLPPEPPKLPEPLPKEDAVRHADPVMVLVSRVTAPV